MTNEYSIAVLLPTRGRTDSLSRSIKSIVNCVADTSSIQILMAFDDDDEIGINHFKSEIQPWLDEKSITYSAKLFTRLGYQGLNLYYNTLAKDATADWFFVWNDDSVMETTGWDDVIRKYNGQFKLLKIHTHNEHPYSIFPIVPKAWYDVTGYLSRHQMIDAELSQIAYMIDVIEIVDIYATHERPDLVGKEEDATDKDRVRFEGNPKNPVDFHHIDYGNHRLNDSEKLARYMKTIGIGTEWWEAVKSGAQDPWDKLKINDINRQMFQYKVDQTTGKLIK